MTVDELVELGLKDNAYGKDDILEARTIFTWLLKGRKKAEIVSKPIVCTLEEMGFAKGNKLIGNPQEELWLPLAIAGAKGFIKQSFTE